MDPRQAAAFAARLAPGNGREYWRSLEELAGDAAFEAFIAREFPSAPAGLERRRFLQLMGASLALGGLAGCGPAPDTAVPYVEQPELIVPGNSRWYASAVPFMGIAQPVLGRTHEGRPTKLEGNPEHPASGGACDAFTQAAILGLYDPDRSQAPRFQGRESSWDAFQRSAVEQARELDARRGEGLHVLLGASSSPSLALRLERWAERWPEARFHRDEPWEGARYAAAERAFGRPLETHYLLQQAELVVSFDDDLLGPGPRQTLQAGRWAERRLAAARGEGEARLVVFEAVPSLTGAKASECRRLDSAGQYRYLQALAAALGEGRAAPLPAAEQRWIEQLAAALRARRGRSLVCVGAYAPLAWQAAAHRLNAMLGNVGRSIEYREPLQLLSVGGRALGDLDTLQQALGAGAVRSLLILDANPVYSAAAERNLSDVLARVPLRIHVGPYYDETAAHSHWHLPQSHALDGWGDARAADGSVCLIQPLVRPFYSARGLGEILALFQGELQPEALAQVRERWPMAEDDWRAALQRGFLEDSAPPPQAVEAAPLALGPPPQSRGLELRMAPDPCVWDGRQANLGWLQELPKPLSKLTWDNVIGVAPALAAQLGLGNGERVRLRVEGDELSGPLWIVPGQAPQVVSLSAGHGRWRCGRVGNGVGFDLAPLRRVDAPWQRQGGELRGIGERQVLASTQLQQSMAEAAPVRALSRAEGAQPALFEALSPSLYPPREAGDTRWGMLIDLDQCIGCNACVVACQAENNIAVVGKPEIAAGRSLHWLRIDHYYKGPPEAPQSAFLPVPCMHCEHAPCELGCPVNATSHGPEGLNQMVYNRCIGTRTCAAYCPYKVRRFNWYDYAAGASPSEQAQRNPDVTVRARGVMEKCTYCVQRISRARIDARKADRELADGEVRTACQQTCPTQAITFGNLADAASAVSRGRESRRHYGLLEELNVRPKTTYLARLLDPRIDEDEA